MKVIEMKDDFFILCKENKEIGPFEDFRRYTRKYPELFDRIYQ